MNPLILMQIPLIQFAPLIMVLALSGCNSTTVQPQAESPTIELTLVCTDQDFAETIAGSIQSWEVETNSRVTVEVRPIDALGQYDVAVLPAPWLGQVVTTGDGVATLPAKIRDRGAATQWFNILRNYANDLCQWGDDIKALPIAGDGVLLVYRKDLFAEARADYRKAGNGDLGPPTSYEELANIGAFFTQQRGKPALTALPKDDAELMSRFHRLAACYDRQARTDIGEEAKNDSSKRDINSIHFEQGTWQPQVESPGFVAAARWFHDTAQSRPGQSQDNPIQALVDGNAVVALVKLSELSQLPVDESGAVESRFAIAPVPGTRFFYDSEGTRRDFIGKPNYVPYLGDSAWVGVVAESSKQQPTAWELLSSIAARQPSIARLSDPNAQTAPYRDVHVDTERWPIWLRYRFPPSRDPTVGRLYEEVPRHEHPQPGDDVANAESSVDCRRTCTDCA